VPRALACLPASSSCVLAGLELLLACQPPVPACFAGLELLHAFACRFPQLALAKRPQRQWLAGVEVRQDEAIHRLWILGEETDLGMKKRGENLKEPDSHYMEGKAIKLDFFSRAYGFQNFQDEESPVFSLRFISAP
jgi:hypothetical protein